MFPHVEDCYFYSRENNIIVANLTHGGKIPLVKLFQNFPNILFLEGQSFDYMKKYMEMFPHLWEYIEEKPKQTEQFKLF